MITQKVMSNKNRKKFEGHNPVRNPELTITEEREAPHHEANNTRCNQFTNHP
jgi:hypothetical protein